MRVYLDDDSASALLARLLAGASHNVQRPAEAGLAGMDDPIHLTHAIREKRVLLTGNHGDFQVLHDLLIQAGGHHPGMLIVRRDNDPRRDLTPRGIVRALENFLSAGISMLDQVIILNHWR